MASISSIILPHVLIILFDNVDEMDMDECQIVIMLQKMISKGLLDEEYPMNDDDDALFDMNVDTEVEGNGSFFNHCDFFLKNIYVQLYEIEGEIEGDAEKTLICLLRKCPKVFLVYDLNPNVFIIIIIPRKDIIPLKVNGVNTLGTKVQQM